MYTLNLKRVPDQGSIQEKGLKLSLKDLGLAEPFLGPGVEVSFQLTRMMERVYGSIQASAQLQGTCSRCLEAATQWVRVDFGIQFEAKPEIENGRPVDGNEDDGETQDAAQAIAYFEGEDLPLGEEIRQELELQVPYAMLCRPTCSGLCSSCGADLNLGPCPCVPTSTSPFAGLAEVLKKDQQQQ